MKHKALVAVVLGAAALLAGVWVLQRPTPVAVVTVTRGEAIDAVYATGAVEPVAQRPSCPSPRKIDRTAGGVRVLRHPCPGGPAA